MEKRETTRFSKLAMGLAVVAAVLAIALAAAAIAFGLWREAQQAQEEEPAVRYETTHPVPHAGDDATQPADDASAPDTPAAGTTQTPEEQ